MQRIRFYACWVVVSVLVAGLVPAGAFAAGAPARLEGLVVGVDGRPAPGYRVHLIDDHGRPVAEAATGDEGLYSVRGLPSGDYSLGIESPSGQLAPVAGPAVRLESGQLARRDLKLLEADETTRNEALTANYGLRTWWAGSTTAAKVWSVIAVVTVAAITYAALDDDDDDDDREEDTSPSR